MIKFFFFFASTFKKKIVRLKIKNSENSKAFWDIRFKIVQNYKSSIVCLTSENNEKKLDRLTNTIVNMVKVFGSY